MWTNGNGTNSVNPPVSSWIVARVGGCATQCDGLSTWPYIIVADERRRLRSSATMMYGHVDNPSHWVAHPPTLATIQDETGGFTEFVPLPFVHMNAPVYLARVARPGPTVQENRAVHAIARLMLHGRPRARHAGEVDGRVHVDERQRDELGEPAGLVLDRRERAKVRDPVRRVVDVAVRHRRGRAQAHLVRRGDDLDPRGCRELALGEYPAEILDDDVRWVLTKGKLPAATWIEIVTAAHQVGLRSSATMTYGHVDNPSHWVAHLRTLATIQDETGGFTEFVPLPFVHMNAPVYLARVARPGPTVQENRAVHA